MLFRSGHGYCTYDFFEQCHHRMACAKCDFYMPKKSTAALLLEGKTHLLRLLQEIPLGEAEQAAVEDGVAAYENLLSKLRDVPTPAGPTPRQIGGRICPGHICASGTASFHDSGLAKYRHWNNSARFSRAIITCTSTNRPITEVNTARS